MPIKSGKRRPSISAQGAIPKLTLDMPLDDEKVSAIRRCLEKGNLTITLSKVDLAAGRLAESYIYD